jgi:site-specific DNA-methyltransferase (adenine-specific)
MKWYYQGDGISIYHGDCRDLIGEVDAELCLTDPPYGINYVLGSDKNDPHESKFVGIPVLGDDKPFNPEPLLIFPKLILWGGNHYANRLPRSAGWFVWDKRCNTTQNCQSDCELAWTNVINSARMFYHVWNGYIRASERDEPRVHPTQKPIALMDWCIKQSKTTGPIIDLYMGSGTTLIAAKRAGRKAFGAELEEKYCEIAARRLEKAAVIPFQPIESATQEGLFAGRFE